MPAKPTTKRLPPPLKWHGGKHKLAPWIVGLMPPHRTYVEPYFGGGSVLLAKPRSAVEVAGDLNAGLIEFWQVLRDDASIPEWLDSVDYSPEEFEMAGGINKSYTPLFRALNFLVRNRMSRGGMGETFAWSDRLREGQPGDVNAWDNAVAALPAHSERIKHVRFRHCHALDLMAECDGPDTLTYLDSPYHPETRTAPKVYDHEMTTADHDEMLAAANGLVGMVMISGYRCSAYNAALAGWKRHDKVTVNHSSQAKTKAPRTECLWLNPAAVAAREAAR